MTKKCFKCEEVKPLEEFYKHPGTSDGRLGKCKDCNKRDVRENYAKRHDYYAAYERMRFSTPERRKTRMENQRRMRARHPDKYRARQMVGNAIRGGRLKRQPCETCGTTKRIQAHHDDYSKPLDVRWFCFKHHREVAHGQLVTAA
jgi:hypothetical protein